VLAEGGYEGRDAVFNSSRPGPWAAGLEDRIVSSLREMIVELREGAASPASR
jgi:hypothetical protein